MKRLLITICVLFLAALTSWAGGIRTAEDLMAFAQAVAKGKSTLEWRNADGEVCLDADIDMSRAKKFRSIAEFDGVFDGQGHRIINWKATGPLFLRLTEGTIKNLIIDGSCSMKVSDGENVYGFIVGVNRGIIENCTNYADVTFKSTFVSKNLMLGGLVGSNLRLVVRCANYGTVSADCISSTETEKPNAMIGGIAGRNGSSKYACCLAWCENFGKVSYVGDLIYDSVGGIVGNGNGGTVKFCVNRGEVTANSSGSQDWSIASRCGGVTGFAKGDVICSDNFGAVFSHGNSSPNTGGVVGLMNDADMVMDCVNYGSVNVSNESPGAVGGVCATVSRAARIKSCINRGDVTYDGVSINKRTAVGGVVGYVYNKKDAVVGAYVRDCVNYGKVTSGKGGNRYENDDKAIHTGGVAGFMKGSQDYQVLLLNCANNGKVEAVGGRCGNIAGACPGVKTGGEYVDEFAASAQPAPDGTNVYGTVKTPDGTPVPGVMVSDGFTTTLTDGSGRYALVSDLSKTRSVYISVPAEYEIPMHEGIPHFFRRVARHEKAVTADFTLTPRKEVNDSYTVLMVADPQIRPYEFDGSAETWRDDVAPDMEAYRASLDEECYAIDLGDLIYNYPVAYDDYMDVAKAIRCPMFNVIGNHDFDQRNMYATELGTPYFNIYAGPENYSFNIGKMHYVVLNDIIYNRLSPKEKYKVGLEDATLEWLRQDLQYVPKETTIVLAVHGQLFKAPKYNETGNPNYERYCELLKDYARVYCWAGHYHSNFGYDYAGKGVGLDNIQAICVSRATGALRVNGYLNSHGTPQGYMVAKVDGSEMTWKYKAVGKSVDEQMTVYEPSRTDGHHVSATVWNWNPDTWGKPEWWENGQKVADMQKWDGNDPDYVKLISTITDEYTLELAQPAKSRFLFKVQPSEGAVSGEVRVSDKFGNVYIKSISW